ncbi:MAG: hypothetical protein CVU39_19830 [Chloroflexi bacterium HGW-Chloroflexi-10]|nr:MAG: hypothetical protein CVU39_19830 [Chloroflexi bacterium HGW-Chloroflexi-10]
MNTSNEDPLKKYFGVLGQAKTYKNFIYLLLAFPLGLTYFIFLVVGFSLGLSLIIIWVGLLILAILFPAIWLLIKFERIQAIYLLDESIPPMSLPGEPEESLLQRTKSFFANPVTWKGLLYLFLKFPIGITQFILLVTGLSIVFALIFAPFAFPWVNVSFGFWEIDSLAEAIGVSVVGLLILPAVLHAFNFIAVLNGKLAKIMLGQGNKPAKSENSIVSLNNINENDSSMIESFEPTE